jgi:hypothetical protein
MKQENIFDAKGSWITNTSQYPFVDPTNGCRFEPGIRTRAPVTAWVKIQPILSVEAEVEVPKAVTK